MRVFESRPSMGRVYLRALTERAGSLPKDAELPRMRSRLDGHELSEEHLEAYRDACGARADVPVGYPQLLATGMHVAQLTQPDFPIRAMGLVHPRFSITQHRPLAPGEVVAFESWFDAKREVRNGIEFDIETRTTVGDELVWESTAATFHRTHSGDKREDAEPEDPEWDRTRPFVVPANAGRRYAKVSGDANPVHLHPLTSRLFGYKRPIAHGWWLVARCLSELGLEGATVPTIFKFDFRRPVFLGSEYQLASIEGDDGTQFAVLDGAGKLRLHGSAGNL